MKRLATRGGIKPPLRTPKREGQTVTAACFQRIRRWRAPPNWSRDDWSEEICAHALAAECQAQADYDAARGVCLERFLAYRVLASSLTRYRQEWAYARRRASEATGGVTTEAIGGGPGYPVEGIRSALSALDAADRWVLEQVFWIGRTESEVAGTLGLSQAAVHKRKRTALRRLRDCLVE